MVVGAVRENDCDVTDEIGASFVLTHQQVAKSTRLAWAITVTASQSREFDGRVCLWDLDSVHYSAAHLYTAATRLKIGDNLLVAPRRGQKRERG